MMDYYTGKINLVVRYLPFHQGSDQMVAMLEAARRQDKFWPVLELMFASQAQWTINHVAQPEIFLGIIEQSGVDVARLRQDMQDPAIQRIITQDLADGETLGANKTPTFFVNGKPLPSFGYKQLQGLVEEELQAYY
jgi:protein-disulfide isomerase